MSTSRKREAPSPPGAAIAGAASQESSQISCNKPAAGSSEKRKACPTAVAPPTKRRAGPAVAPPTKSNRSGSPPASLARHRLGGKDQIPKMNGIGPSTVTVSARKQSDDSENTYKINIRVHEYVARLDYGLERCVASQSVQMNVNCSEIVSVSQLVAILHARIPWGSKQKAKFVWMNMNQVYEQLEHSHQLLQIWEKYKDTRQLDLFVMVDDVDAPEAQLGVKGVDPDGGAPSGMDACKLAAIDHSQMYLIALQVDPYTAVLDDGQEFAVQNDHMEIMVDPKTVTVDQILERLKQRCPWGPNQQARLRWWHFKKRDFIDIVKDDDLMQVFRRKKLSKKVFFVVAISEMVGDDETAVDLSS